MQTFLRLATLLLVLTTGAAQAQDWFDGAATPDTDTVESTDGNGAQTRAELCRNACDRDYAICGDEGSAAADTLDGRPSASQLDAIRCKDDLAQCLKGCKGL